MQQLPDITTEHSSKSRAIPQLYVEAKQEMCVGEDE
jgi:hypothetical protein